MSVSNYSYFCLECKIGCYRICLVEFTLLAITPIVAIVPGSLRARRRVFPIRAVLKVSLAKCNVALLLHECHTLLRECTKVSIDRVPD